MTRVALSLRCRILSFLLFPVLSRAQEPCGEWSPGLFPLNGVSYPIGRLQTLDDGSGSALYATTRGPVTGAAYTISSLAYATRHSFGICNRRLCHLNEARFLSADAQNPECRLQITCIFAPHRSHTSGSTRCCTTCIRSPRRCRRDSGK